MEKIEGITTLFNQCVKCNSKWQVIGNQSSLDWEDIWLDDNDIANVGKYGQLFSVCEDCNEHGYDCYSVLKMPKGWIENE